MQQVTWETPLLSVRDVSTERGGGLGLSKRTDPPHQCTTPGELSYRVWARKPSYQEEPHPWRCVAVFCYLTEALDYIACCQDNGSDVVFQSPADCREVKATDRRVVYKAPA